ncbi:MAG: hypothetical protein Q4A12_02805, partial [Eubacteriales bacterium]|nr:hypothetical protein [Eubacteriales bacterium]
VNIVPSFLDYRYVSFTNDTGLTIENLKAAYKQGEEVNITVKPASGQVSINGFEFDNAGLTATENADGSWSITGTMPADTDIAITPSVEAKFAVNSQQVSIGNYGTGVTVFGTVTMTDEDGNTINEGSYVDPGTVVTYSAAASTNYTFVGFYSDGACDQPIKVGADSTNVTVNADTTVYALFARKQWMTFDQSKTSGSYVKELVYDPSIGAYTLTTTLTTGNSTDSAINTGAWFRVTNNTSKWSTAEGYHVFDASKFTVNFNTNGYGATIGWAVTDGSSNAWKLTTGGESGQSIKFILTPNGNESIDFSASTTKEGATIYLSSGTLSLPGTYSSESVFTTTGITVSDSGTLTHDPDGVTTNIESYKKADIATAQMIEFKTTLSGDSAADYYVDSFIIYDILDKTYTIVTPNTLGNNAYSGTVYVDSDCYIVPIYFHTDKYLAANNMKAVDVYFDATAIDGTNWGPFVSVYSWGSGGNKYSGVWPGQLMIPTEDGSSFYTQLEVPDAELGNTSSIPQGLQFMNYLFDEITVPSKFASGFGIAKHTIQTYDYREPITLYDEDYDVITFVAKTSEDGYHGDSASGQSVVKNVTTTTNAKTAGCEFETLVCRDGVTPMDLTGKAIEGAVSNTPDYYVVSKGDIKYDVSTKTYAGDTNFDADWAVDWYIFDKDGNYLAHTLSTAMWHYADGENDTTSELEEALDLADGVLDGKLVYITYEAPNNSSTQPHQLCYDGQWYGNLLDDDVYADVMVGLVDENGNFVIDTVDQTNDADYGEGWLIAEEERDGYTVGEKYASLPISLDHGAVSLTATTKDGYRFYGWYTESNGKYTKISDAYNYETYINLNTTYYAMFKQIGNDEVVINHLPYDNPYDPYIPSHGGVSQMVVKVVDSEGNVVAEGTPSTSISTAVFVPEYNQTSSTYEKYTVKITTTPLMNGEFYAWYTDSEDADGNDTYEEVLVEKYMVGSTTMVQSEFTYEYNDEDPVKVINIYSDVTRVSNKATLYYKYLNRFGEWRTYTVRDVELSDEECLGYDGNNDNAYFPTYITKYVMIKGNDERTVYGDTAYEELLEQEYALKSSYNMVTDYAPSDEVTEAFGKTTEWTITDTNITLSKSVVTLEAIQNPEQYTITYTEGNSSEWKTVSGSYNELVQITASGYDGEEWGQGKPFSHWEQYNNETEAWEFLSFERYYNYRIIEDKMIRAEYGEDLVDEWMPRIDSVTYTREYSDNSDYIYTDYLVAFNNVNTLNLNEIKDEQNITYGLVLVQDWNYRYSGTDAVTYPSSSVNNIEDLVRETAKACANYSPDKGNIRCYHYDMTNEPTTNLNRLYHYLSYNLNNGKYDYGQFAFTTYAYINVGGKIYISNGMDVNFYELAHEETAANPTH